MSRSINSNGDSLECHTALYCSTFYSVHGFVNKLKFMYFHFLVHDIIKEQYSRHSMLLLKAKFNMLWWDRKLLKKKIHRKYKFHKTFIDVINFWIKIYWHFIKRIRRYCIKCVFEIISIFIFKHVNTRHSVIDMCSISYRKHIKMKMKTDSNRKWQVFKEGETFFLFQNVETNKFLI